MASVLILQPYRPDTPPALLQRGGALLDALMAATPDHQVTVLRGPAAPPADVGPERYAPTGPRYGVEHWSVCSGAAARGMPVRAYADRIATHAWLPDHGLPHR